MRFESVDIGGHTVIHGDALAVLRELPSDSFDVVLTDPPYCTPVGGRTNLTTGSKYQSLDSDDRLPDFVGDVRTQRGFELWVSLWTAECFRLVRKGGALVSFMGWSNLASMTDAVQAGGWFYDGLVLWEKPAGRPRLGWYSTSRSEFVVCARKGPTPREGTCGPFHVTGSVAGVGRTHMAEKPADVVAELIAFRPDWVNVLDPFFGSGTTAVACEMLGRRCTGIETSRYLYDASIQRVTTDVNLLREQINADARRAAV